MTHDHRVTLISQEQTAQGENIAELKRKLGRVERNVQDLQQEVATLKAAWVASKTEGAGCRDCDGASSA